VLALAAGIKVGEHTLKVVYVKCVATPQGVCLVQAAVQSAVTVQESIQQSLNEGCVRWWNEGAAAH
jgi:hypothetical protein